MNRTLCALVGMGMMGLPTLALAGIAGGDGRTSVDITELHHNKGSAPLLNKLEDLLLSVDVIAEREDVLIFRATGEWPKGAAGQVYVVTSVYG